jgi:hypothetical protein
MDDAPGAVIGYHLSGIMTFKFCVRTRQTADAVTARHLADRLFCYTHYTLDDAPWNADPGTASASRGH